jgi:hypothetical protein
MMEKEKQTTKQSDMNLSSYTLSQWTIPHTLISATKQSRKGSRKQKDYLMRLSSPPKGGDQITREINGIVFNNNGLRSPFRDSRMNKTFSSSDPQKHLT